MRKTLLFATIVGSLSVLASAQTSTDQQAQPATAVTQASQAAADQTPATVAPVKKKAKHVYTSDDMKAADPNDVPSVSSSSSGGDSAGTPGSAAKDDKTAKSKKTAKKIDPAAVAAQQAKVDDLKGQVDGENKVIANIQRLIAEQPSRAANMGPGLNKQQSDLTDLQKQLSTAQSQLDSMKNPK